MSLSLVSKMVLFFWGGGKGHIPSKNTVEDVFPFAKVRYVSVPWRIIFNSTILGEKVICITKSRGLNIFYLGIYFDFQQTQGLLFPLLQKSNDHNVNDEYFHKKVLGELHSKTRNSGVLVIFLPPTLRRKFLYPAVLASWSLRFLVVSGEGARAAMSRRKLRQKTLP